MIDLISNNSNKKPSLFKRFVNYRLNKSNKPWFMDWAIRSVLFWLVFMPSVIVIVPALYYIGFSASLINIFAIIYGYGFVFSMFPIMDKYTGYNNN